MTTKPAVADEYRVRMLDTADRGDRAALGKLRDDPRIEVIDLVADQRGSLRRLTPPPEPDLLRESTRWVYYPWRRTVIAVLGPRAFRRVRLDRNRNLITLEEQDRLAAMRIGIAGLSIGHAVALTLAAQGLCGKLRLADFDGLELTNLNRVPATIFDLMTNKAVVAARKIAELDPYLSIEVMTAGVTPQSLDEFLDGLDIVVEECDSLDMKVMLREAARDKRLPVLMATSDRGLVDVERYDMEASRPVLHGLLGDVDAAGLADLTSTDKVPHVLRLIDAASLKPTGAASLIEMGHSLSTWPQLAGDVTAGAGAVAEAVRRITLGEYLPSGRAAVDIAAALDHLADPGGHASRSPAAVSREEADDTGAPATVADAVAAAAIRAPSGGNAQPWRVIASDDSITIRLEPDRISAMDVGLRGSAVAVGAAVFNARIAAAAHDVLGSVTVSQEDGAPLRAVVGLDGDGDPALSGLYRMMLDRRTNRHRGRPGRLDSEIVAGLQSVAAGEGARLRLLTATDDIAKAAAILGEADRIRFLTPRLHADMVAELRWPGDEDADTGIDLRSMELDDATVALFDVLRRPDVAAQLAEWDGGAALSADMRDRVVASSAVCVVSVSGRTLVDYAAGGSAAEAVWIAAQQRGFAVQPVSPVFLYAHGESDLTEMSPRYAPTLRRLRTDFLELVGTAPEESPVLVMRLFKGPLPSVRSRRRRS